MNKKLLFTIIITFLLFSGCGKASPSNVAQQNGQMPIVTASDSIDYDQYIKKTWFTKNTIDDSVNGIFSFYISKIDNGEIKGKFVINGLVVADSYYLPDEDDKLENLTGTINNGIAECKFDDEEGNKGEVELHLKSKDEIEATIKFMDKSQNTNNSLEDGTFQLKSYNIRDINGFSPFNDQCFNVNLNSWGNIKFISGQVTGGNHVPTVLYLTDNDENILYDFDSTLPYYADIKDVSFEDLNKDGLKDIIIIATDDYQVPVGKGEPIAVVFFQKSDGSFIEDNKLNSQINTSENNNDVQSAKEYLYNNLPDSNYTSKLQDKLNSTNTSYNKFFFKDILSINKYTYKGTVWGDNILDGRNENVDGEGGVYVKANLTVLQIAKLSKGNIYELDFSVKGDKNNTQEKDESLYLWVTEDTIYKLSTPSGSDDKELYENGRFNYLIYAKKLENSGQLPSTDKSLILCSNDNMNSVDGKWEREIKVEDNICTYHSYNDGTSSYEKFVWKAGKGLTDYSWRQGARAVGMDLHLVE